MAKTHTHTHTHTLQKKLPQKMRKKKVCDIYPTPHPMSWQEVAKIWEVLNKQFHIKMVTAFLVFDVK